MTIEFKSHDNHVDIIRNTEFIGILIRDLNYSLRSFKHATISDLEQIISKMKELQSEV